MLVCAVSLTAHWGFLFWHQQHLRNLPEVIGWTAAAKNKLASQALYPVIVSSVVGNFIAAALARRLGYRRTIAVMSFGYMLAVLGAYGVARSHQELLFWLPVIGFFQGLFALYTMYLPPLFPTLLRTTGAGFCYNIGRVFAAIGTVLFGLVWTAKVGDYRTALIAAGLLFLPAGVFAFSCRKAERRRAAKQRQAAGSRSAKEEREPSAPQGRPRKERGRGVAETCGPIVGSFTVVGEAASRLPPFRATLRPRMPVNSVSWVWKLPKMK